MCPSPGLCSPGNSSHSAIVTVSVSLLLPMGWGPRGEPLTLGAAPCRADLTSWHCGDLLGSTPPQDCLQLSSAMACRTQVLLAGLKLLVSVTLTERSYNLLVCDRWRGGTHPSMLLHSREKKSPEKFLSIESTKNQLLRQVKME